MIFCHGAGRAIHLAGVVVALTILFLLDRLEVAADAAVLLNVRPQHLLAGQEEVLRFTSSVALFTGGSASYQLVMTESSRASGGAPPKGCTWKSKKEVSCKASWPSVGPMTVFLQEGASNLGMAAVSVYEQPQVLRITPSNLSLSGGSLVRVAFKSRTLQHDLVMLRLAYMQSGSEEHIHIPLNMNEDGTEASGRSPPAPLGMISGTVVQTSLSLNGQSFVATGHSLKLVSKPPLKVGFILVGTPQDFGWNFQHNYARLVLEDRFFGQVTTLSKEYVSEWGPNMCDFCADLPGWNASKKLGMWDDEPSNFFGTHESAMVMRKWIEEEGVNMIITTSWYFHWDTYHMAAAYPDTYFVHASGYLSRPNMANTFPKVYQARYLSGIAMAWYIKKHGLKKRVGYVSAFPVGETVRHINAFKLGMEQVDPDIEVYLAWLFTWHDDRKERIGASRLLKYYGVEGIAQHTDSRMPQITAKDYGKVGVGYNTDMLLTVGDSVLTSPVLVWSEDYARLVQNVLDGGSNFGTGAWTGAEEGSWRLSDFSPIVPVEAKIQIAQEHAKLLRGEDTIFCKPNLRDNKGRLRNDPSAANPTIDPPIWEANHIVPGTTCLTDPVVSMSCQKYEEGDCKEFWFVEGVVDSCDGLPELDGLPNGTCFLGGMDLPDKCPDGMHLQIEGCKNASAGFFARDEQEFPCPLGFAAPSEGMMACQICQASTAAGKMNSTSCTSCLPGFFAQEAGMSECAPCPAGKFSSGEGAAECGFCPVNTYSKELNSTECTACPLGRSTRLMGASCSSDCVCSDGFADVDGICSKCGEGLVCGIGSSLSNWENVQSKSTNQSGSGTYPKVKKGYYATADNPLEAFYCLSDEACPGGDPGKCGPLRHKLACGECIDGYVAYGHDTCWECDLWKPWRAVLILICSPAAVLLAYRLMNYPFQTVFDLKRKAQHAGFLLLIYMQTIALIRDFDLDYPKGMQSVGAGLQVLNVNLDIVRPSCGVGEDFVAAYIVKLLVPFFCLIAFAVTYAVCKLLYAVMRSMTFLDLDLPKLQNVYLSCLNTFYIGLTRLATSVFQCYDHPSGKRSMLSAPHILCNGDGDDETWTHLVPVSFAAMLFYTVGIFLLFGFVNWKAPERFHDPRFRRRWLFLLTKFRPDFWWWDQLLLLKGLALNLTAMLFSSVSSRVYWVMLVQSTYAMGLFLVRPWRHHIANVVDMVITSIIMALLALGLWFTTNLKLRWTDELEDAYTIWLFIFAVFPPCMVFVYVIYIGFRYNRQRAETRDCLAFSAQLRQVLSWALKEDSSSFNSFLMRLTDQEYNSLKSTRDVLITELFQKQPSHLCFRQRLCLASNEHKVVDYDVEPTRRNDSLEKDALNGLRYLREALQDPAAAYALGMKRKSSSKDGTDSRESDDEKKGLRTSKSSDMASESSFANRVKIDKAQWNTALQDIDRQRFRDEDLRNHMFNILDMKQRGFLQLDRLLGVLDAVDGKALEKPKLANNGYPERDPVEVQEAATWVSESLANSLAAKEPKLKERTEMGTCTENGKPSTACTDNSADEYASGGFQALEESDMSWPGKLVVRRGVADQSSATYAVTPRLVTRSKTPRQSPRMDLWS